MTKAHPLWLSGKESTCNAGDAGDVGSIPGLGRSPGGWTKVHSSNLAWRIPWTEEPSVLQSIGSQSESESCSVLFDSLWPVGLHSLWNSPGQNTGVDSLSLLQGIFPTQVSCIAGRFFTSWATRVPKSQIWLKRLSTYACTRTKHFRTWFFFHLSEKEKMYWFLLAYVMKTMQIMFLWKGGKWECESDGSSDDIDDIGTV